MTIRDNLDTVRKNITEAAEKYGRSPGAVRLVAVSKLFPATTIEEAYLAGQTLFGENYIQEAEQKIEKLPKDIHFHFIGHLQSNKAKLAAQLFSMIETVDSLKIARALNTHLMKLSKTLDILVQVNIGDDLNKSGIASEQTRDLLREIKTLPFLCPLGLMTMPPYTADAEKARPFFRELRQLSETLGKEGLFFNNDHIELSMGMSHDYHIAIEEGATLVRVGTAIFGERDR